MAGTTIFGSEGVSKYTGGFDGTKASVTFGDNLNTLICTNISVNYQRNIQKIFSMSNHEVFFVVGRGDGSGSIQSVFGPKAHNDAFFANFGSPCSEKRDMTFEFRNDGGGGTLCQSSGLTRTCTSVLLQALSMSVTSQDMLVNDNINFQFVELLNGRNTPPTQ